MKKLAGLLGVLCLAASAIMYLVGSDSSHLSELKDYFWVPLGPGILFLIILLFKK